MNANQHLSRARAAKLKKAAPWSFVEAVFSGLITFVSTLIIARLIAPAEFGLAALALAAAALVQVLSAGGLPSALVREPSVTTRLYDQALTVLVGFGLAGSLLCWLIGWVLARTFDQPALLLLTGVSGLSCLLVAVGGVPTAIFTRKMRTRRLALATLVSKASTALVAIPLVVLGWGAWGIVLGAVGGAGAGTATLWLGAPRRPSLLTPTQSVVPVLRASWLLSIEQTVGSLATRGFMLLFGYFHSLHDVGILNFAIRLIDEVAALITTTVRRVSLAIFSSLVRSGETVNRAFLEGTHGLTLICAPVFLGIAAVAPELVSVVFGDKWSPAVPVLQIFCVLWALRSTRLLAPAVVISLGAQRHLAENALLSAPLVLAFAVLTQDAPFIVAAAAYHSAMLVTLPRGITIVRSVSGIRSRTQLAASALPILCALGMAVLVRLVITSSDHLFSPVVLLMTGIAAGVLTYAALVFMIDRRSVMRLIRQIQSS